MRVPKLDLRTSEQKDEPKKKLGRFAVFFIVLFLAIGALAFSTNVVFSDHPIINLGSHTFLGEIRALVRSGDRKLAGETNDRVNMLILGIGGEGHDGPQLTDTVILASFKPSEKRVSLISIPRDLAMNTKDFGTVKLNSINAYAEARAKGSGPGVEAVALSEALGQPISYWGRIDFRGFEKMIDAVGGVDVTVDRSFTDTTFPTDDAEGTVKTIAFTAGTQHMNGKTALEFARSRHGSNGEGSDFARSKRQEKIMLAVREKMLRAGTLLNPFTLNSLFETIKGSLITNLETWEIVRLAQEASGIKTADVSLKVMSDDNILSGGINGQGAYVLTPKNGDWNEVKNFVANAFNEPVPVVVTETKAVPLRVMVQNGTKVVGLAQRTADTLVAAGFKDVKTGNAKDQKYDKTVVYDLSGKTPKDTVTKIISLIDGNMAPSVPASLPIPANTDLLIILGKNTTL